MSKHKLLLADDSVTIQKVVQLTFADEGIDVSVAGDGDMAMLKFLESEPDIVLADVHMPGLNGYQVCERIKENGDSVPVVLLVGSFEPFDTEEANRVGADGFLTKPFQSIRQLVEVVSNLLASRGSDNASANSPASGASDGSFAETREIPAYGETADLGDSGMDDEMIETAPARDFLEADTLPRYSEVVDQDNPDEDIHVSNAQPEGYADETGAADDSAADDLVDDLDDTESVDEDFTEARTADLPAKTRIEFENEDESPLDTGADFEDTLETPEPKAAPDDEPNGEADDSNLLEIPFIRSIVPPLSRTSGAPVAEKAPPALTPEFIEEVTQRVMERLSSGAFRDLVKEVVPQVVREVTEEQMKD